MTPLRHFTKWCSLKTPKQYRNRDRFRWSNALSICDKTGVLVSVSSGVITHFAGEDSFETSSGNVVSRLAYLDDLWEIPPDYPYFDMDWPPNRPLMGIETFLGFRARCYEDFVADDYLYYFGERAGKKKLLFKRDEDRILVMVALGITT